MPAAHFAHHTLAQDDGIGYNCNLLFLWDVLFGTSHIDTVLGAGPHSRPK